MLTAFGAASDTGELLPGARRRSWRYGNVVVRAVDDPAEASWVATGTEQLHVRGVRLARPVRSSDGRWVVSGWTAHRFVSGSPAARHEETLAAAVALHEALAPFAEPRFLRGRTDLNSWADRVAWGEAEDEGRLGTGYGAGVFATLASGRLPVQVPQQIVDGHLYGRVLFAGSAPPAIVGIRPYWRPVGWASALVAIDCITRGGGPIEILAEGEPWPQWPQMVRRALLFRLAASLAHPLTPPAGLVTLLSTAERIAPLLN